MSEKKGKVDKITTAEPEESQTKEFNSEGVEAKKVITIEDVLRAK